MAPVVVHALAVAPVGGAFIESAKIQSSPSHPGLLTYWLEGRVTEKARLFSLVICFCQLSSVFCFLSFKVFSLLDSKSFPVKFPVLEVDANRFGKLCRSVTQRSQEQLGDKMRRYGWPVGD